MKRLITIALLALPSFAIACEPGEAQVFSCTTVNGKPVEVCQAANTVNYRFGAKPDMEVKVPTADLKWEQDSGSHAGTDDLHFPKGDTVYRVSYGQSFDNSPLSEGAQIYVSRAGKQLASLQCSEGTVKFTPESLKAKHRPYE